MKLYMIHGESCDISTSSSNEKELIQFITCTTILWAAPEHFGFVEKGAFITPKDLYKKVLVQVCLIDNEDNEPSLKSKRCVVYKMNYLIDKYGLQKCLDNV